MPKAQSPLARGENRVLLHPRDHFGLVVDLFDNTAHSTAPENMGVGGETSLHPKAGDMPRDEAIDLYRARFGCRKVDIRNIRGAVNNLGVGIAEDSNLGAVFGTVRQVFHNRDAWGKKGVTALKNAIRLPGLATS